jgi:fructose-1,6-bisphosphatase/inositol monophosphatase family enzyme
LRLNSDVAAGAIMLQESGGMLMNMDAESTNLDLCSRKFFAIRGMTGGQKQIIEYADEIRRHIQPLAYERD